MPNMTESPRTALRRVTRSLERQDEKSEDLRRQRNRLIFQALTEDDPEKGRPLTEREAAEEAGVSPAYAHRVKVHKGEPPSGNA